MIRLLDGDSASGVSGATSRSAWRRDSIEDYLIDWIDMDYAPEHYSQAQLDELDRLTARWISDHARRAKTSKK